MSIILSEYNKYKKDMIEGERSIISNYELNIDHCSVGTVCNKVNDLFEVYIYIIDNTNETTLSSLALVNLEDKEKAISIFEEYSELIKNNELKTILDFISK